MPRGRLSIYQILNHFSKFKHHEEPSGIKGLDSHTECVIALILTDVCILSMNLSSMGKRASTYTFTLYQKHTYTCTSLQFPAEINTRCSKKKMYFIFFIFLYKSWRDNLLINKDFFSCFLPQKYICQSAWFVNEYILMFVCVTCVWFSWHSKLARLLTW